MDEGRNASPTGHDEQAAWIYVIDRSFECCPGFSRRQNHNGSDSAANVLAGSPSF